jgi:hypothetical protein
MPNKINRDTVRLTANVKTADGETKEVLQRHLPFLVKDGRKHMLRLRRERQLACVGDATAFNPHKLLAPHGEREKARRLKQKDFKNNMWILNVKDSKQFIGALLNPPEPNEALKAAAARLKENNEKN